MENILHRVLQLADKEGIKITALESKIGASKGVLSRAIKKNTDIQTKWIVEIVENYPHYNSEWLLTGKGSMLKEEKEDIYSQKEDILHIRKEVSPYNIDNKSSEEVINKLKDDKIALMQEKMNLIIENADLKTENISLTHKLKEYENQIKDLQLQNKELSDQTKTRKDKSALKKEQLLPTANILIDQTSKHTNLTKNR